MKTLPLIVNTACAVLLMTVSGYGQVVVETTANNYNIRGTTASTTSSNVDQSFQLGRGTVPGVGGTGTVDAVYIFELPVLTEALLSVSFEFQVTGTNQGTFGSFNNLRVDLTGEGFKTDQTPITTFSSSTLLEDNILIGSDYNDGSGVVFPSTVNTSVDGTTALTSYVDNFYTANPGYAGGTFMFLRLDQNGSNVFDQVRFNVNSAAFASSTPFLTFNTIPEPTSAALILGSGLLLVARRRRK